MNVFSQAAKFLRGIVGVVEVAGTTAIGDEISGRSGRSNFGSESDSCGPSGDVF
jgi:hypothetical protein